MPRDVWRLWSSVDPVPKLRAANAPNLAAHQGRGSKVSDGRQQPRLPMALGTIAASHEGHPAGILGAESGRLLRSSFQRVAGKVEMGLRVAWDVPNIFEYFVNPRHAETALGAVTRLLARPPTSSPREEKIELGRMFEPPAARRPRGPHPQGRAQVLALGDSAEFHKANPCRQRARGHHRKPRPAWCGARRRKSSPPACSRQPSGSTTISASTIADPGRRTTSSNSIWSSDAAGGRHPLFSFSPAFCGFSGKSTKIAHEELDGEGQLIN